MRGSRAVLACAVAALLYGLGVSSTPAPATAMPPAPEPATVLPAGPGPLPARSTLRPVGLLVPRIGVDLTFLETLEVAPNGALNAPADFANAGWYARGTIPGDPGPAVLAGHVDSRRGPAVFFRLRDLRPGDQVTVRMSDGGNRVFTVDAVQRHPKDEFPTTAVYGPVPGAALRLITCGGSFDRSIRSYRDNIVVFATLS